MSGSRAGFSVSEFGRLPAGCRGAVVMGIACYAGDPGSIPLGVACHFGVDMSLETLSN